MANSNATTFDASKEALEVKWSRLLLRLKAIPWTRAIVDVMLLAALLVFSSKLFVP